MCASEPSHRPGCECYDLWVLKSQSKTRIRLVPGGALDPARIFDLLQTINKWGSVGRAAIYGNVSASRLRLHLSNPVQSQYVNQSGTTSFNFVGIVDFIKATVRGLALSIAGSSLSVNSGAAISLPNLVDTSGAGGIGITNPVRNKMQPRRNCPKRAQLKFPRKLLI